jgi:hypothetical protein
METAAVFHPGLRTGYVQQYSVSIQRELVRGIIAEAAWVGNRGIKLVHQTMPNQRKIHGDFLHAFRELQDFSRHGIVPGPANTLVRIFGTPQAAATVLSNSLDQNAAGAAAETVDTLNYSLYPAAGVSPFYIRNYPQFNSLFLATNDGRSYYDSLQLSIRVRANTTTFQAHYTFSKVLDVISNSGAAPESVIDQFNLRLNRGRADFDRTHVLSTFATWMLPFGKGGAFGRTWPRWLQSIASSWEVSGIAVWESGSPFSVRSGRQTTGSTAASFADYSGDRNIGSVQRRGDGVYYFTPEEISRFTLPLAGEIGTAGRNTFRGPRFFDIDFSAAKRFLLTEGQSLTFRAELYNAINNPNFGNPGASLTNPATLGRITSGLRGLAGAPIGETFGGPRVVQLALRLDF